jgi:hypothetical protein
MTPEHRAATEPIPAVDGKPAPTLLDHLGGPSGMVYTTVPVVAFATAVAVVALPTAIGIALGVGLGFAGWRLLRGERLTTALSGVLGVAAAGAVAAWTGSAKDFFLIGIWAALAGAAVLLGSVVVRRPLTGVVWNALHGGKHPWRADRPTLLAHDIATLAATAVFAARFVVKQSLYLADATGWLAVAKIAMGTPLTALALLVVVWAFRRSTKRLIGPAGRRR